MKPQLKSSAAARALIKRFEPFNGTAIIGDDGHWVVGYGHKAAAKPGTTVSPEEADLLLIYDVLNAETAIDDVVNTPLKLPQRDALVSFVHDIGGEAFKRSDVARYLFEGRAMAAGEALAIYGDHHADRREAENTLFMTAFAPPASRRGEEREQSTVELVIKVEHPADIAAETPAEPALAATAPAEADLAPPPPSARDLAARRAAEDEISRILVAVGEMPVESLQVPVEADPVEDEAVVAPVVMPVAAPEPVARDLAADAEPEDTPPPPVEDVTASIDGLQDHAESAAVEPVTAPEEAAPEETAPEETASEETAPEDTALTDTETSAVATPDPATPDPATPDPAAPDPATPAENYSRADEVSIRPTPPRRTRSVFDGVQSSPLAALIPQSPLRHMPRSDVSPAGKAPADPDDAKNTPEDDAETEASPAATSIPLSDVQSAVDTDPVDEAVHSYDVPADLPEETAPQEAELATDPASGTRSDPAAAQVIARMSQEIAAAQVEPREEHRGRASVQMYDESLPEGATLGFVIAGELAAHFDEEPATETEVEDTVAEAAADEDSVVETVAEPAAEDDPVVEAEFARLAEIMSEEEAAAAETEPSEATDASHTELDAELAAVVDAAADPVEDADDMVEAEPAAVADERQMETETADEAAPVAETVDEEGTIVAQVHDVVEQAIAVAGQDAPPPHPAFEAASASGSVGEVGADASLNREPVHVHDALVETGEAEALDDDFSPADLAGEDDLYTDNRTVEPHKDRSAGWFVLVLLAGLTLSVYGGLFTYLEWDRVWGARELTSGAWALIAGSFFSVMALWQLVSIWMEKRKEKAPI